MNQEIALRCIYNPYPGFQRTSEIRFASHDGRTVVREWIDNDQVWRMRRSLNGEPAWRRLALYLSRRSPEWCLPADALGDIRVQGCDGWRGELLAVCWCRFGEDKERNYGRWLVRLTDSQLKALWRDFGTVVGLSPANPTLIEHLDRLRPFTPKHQHGLRFLLERRSPRLGAGFLAQVVRELEVEALEAKLEAVLNKQGTDID